MSLDAGEIMVEVDFSIIYVLIFFMAGWIAMLRKEPISAIVLFGISLSWAWRIKDAQAAGAPWIDPVQEWDAAE